MTKTQRLVFAAVVAAVVLTGCLTLDPTVRYENKALSQTVRSNNHIFEFVARKAVDGETLTYWEGAADSYPNLLTVDLGREMKIHAVRVRLNPRLIWQAREQTFAILVSSNGEIFSQAVPERAYPFDPEGNENTVTVDLSEHGRYVQLVFSANTEATGGQVAELEVYAE
jgi:F5/8 type C domain